jgi:oxamate amidohydrolase
VAGVIATPHALATRAGVEAYAAGGNAVDAALAAAAVLTVVYPHQCALGGDLFALVAQPDGQCQSVNGSGAAAAGVMAEGLRPRYEEVPDSGPIPITVPGIVHAWQTIHGLGAALGFARLLAPAIAAAREGVPVSRSLERGIQQRLGVVSRDPGLSARFLADGKPLCRGMSLRQPQLAVTLERLADSGAAAFYSGTLAGQMVGYLRRLGSVLSESDFAEHRTHIDSPLTLALGRFELQTSPPNSQGFVLLEALAAVQAAGESWEAMTPGSRRLLLALLTAIEDRDRYLGDPRHAPVPLEQLLAPRALRERMQALDRGASAASPGNPPAHGDTVAVCALDGNGMAVSLIQSVFQLFGSGILEPLSGVIFHNRGRGFSLRRGAANELLPGTRPAHTLMPLIVRQGGRVRAALGCVGGRAQPQILAQVLPAVTSEHGPLAAALRRPRWVVGSKDIDCALPTVAIEADAPAGWDSSLRIAGYDLQRISALNELVGHAQAVRVRADGTLEGASDPRSDGAAAVLPPSS